jgi:hypothetical protein
VSPSEQKKGGDSLSSRSDWSGDVGCMVMASQIPEADNPDSKEDQERTPEQLPGKLGEEDTQPGHNQYGSNYESAIT